MLTRSGQKQVALSLSPPPPTSSPEWGACRVIARPSMLPGRWPSSGQGASACAPHHAHRRCRLAPRIPPGTLHLQVLPPGGGSAKPRLCAFAFEGKKGGWGGEWRTVQQWPSSRSLFPPHMGTSLAMSPCVTQDHLELRAPLWSAALSTPTSCRVDLGCFHPFMVFCLSR